MHTVDAVRNRLLFLCGERNITINKLINFIVTIVGFISGIMAIIMGWNDFWVLIKSLI